MATVPLPAHRDVPVVVLGLGRSGLAAAEALAAAGARVQVWDDNPEPRRAAADRGFTVTAPDAVAWDATHRLVMSPGIPLPHPEPHPAVRHARAHGVPVTCDVELLWEARPEATFVGVTGTNGKSTTTALIGHLLTAAGRRVAVGGNLGRPALTLDPLGAGDVYVLELSSYQLDLLDRAVMDVAVLTTITPDHLDRHGGMEGYVTAKRRIFRGGARPQTFVVGTDDPYSTAIAEDLAPGGSHRLERISGHHAEPGGVAVVDGVLTDHGAAAADLTDVATLPGPHNGQNAAAAWAAARALDAPRDTLAAALKQFPGLAHRQEMVDTVDGVLFVNDSKATNAEAAATAVACYDGVYWIGGGRPKEGGLEALRPWFGHIRRAFLIGEAEGDFAAVLANAGVPAERCGDLATAVDHAHAAARADTRSRPVVLLSPACASFDQYSDFAARGDAFRARVTALPGHHAEREAS